MNFSICWSHDFILATYKHASNLCKNKLQINVILVCKASSMVYKRNACLGCSVYSLAIFMRNNTQVSLNLLSIQMHHLHFPPCSEMRYVPDLSWRVMGTDDLHNNPALWTFGFLLPPVCSAPLPQYNAVFLCFFTSTAADKLSNSQPHFLVIKRHPLPKKVGDSLIYGKYVGDGQLCDHRKAHYERKETKQPYYWSDELGPSILKKQADPCRTHRHTLSSGHLWWCKAGEDRRRSWAVKSIVVLCSWYLGNPAVRYELWMKCRSETAAVIRLDISWLKSLVSPVFGGPRPHKTHTHMLWVPAWCGAVGRVHKHCEEVQISFLPSQLLSFTHRIKTSLFMFPPKFPLPPSPTPPFFFFLFLVLDILSQGLWHISPMLSQGWFCEHHIYSL